MQITLEDCNDLQVKNGVVILNDSTLFLRQKNKAQKQFDYMLGNIKLSKSSIENFQENMASNISFTTANNCKYHHIIFPTKAMAYIADFSNLGFSIYPIVKDVHLTYKVYYPDATSLKKDYYVKDGNHCSCIGYLSIVEPVLNKLGYSFQDIVFQFVTTNRLGDLGRMIGAQPIKRKYISGAIGHENIQSFSNLAALKGNTGEFRIKINNDAVYKERLLLFGDSFFVGCLTILSVLFEEVIYVRKPYVDQDLSNKLKPDVILTGNAERYLTNVPDSRDDKPYFLSLINPAVDMSKLSSQDIEAINMIFLSRSSDRYKAWKRKLLNGF
ncbi:hypothetical protein NQT72_13180 [Pseudoalteromonas carrageenovora]|uniref:hypothetical protein n=1 Tax=Pseudoalteromonas carrageenovora TaxID=227 RepID=UPI0021173616|nr:hypothetical protein [Pseudoalteromonas carrageenovora]MCQ8890457.1 hypothetical protein [Pseudoalteromonas carrageenovora]